MKAVVFIDVQKDFIDGALKNAKAIEVTPKIVEFAKKCAADPEFKLYATRDTHAVTKYAPNHDSQIDPGGELYPVSGYLATLEGKKLPYEHCIEGTSGWMIDNKLMDAFFAGYAKDETGLEDKDHPVYNCTIVNKPTFGSFDLAEIINEDFFETYQYIENLHCNVKCLPRVNGEKLNEIILCGFCTDICVVSNALLLRAKFPDVKITVMKDLCAGVTPESHEAALKVMQSCQIDVV